MVDLKDMTLEQAWSELSRSVYDATRLLERLERAGKVHGNGHHMRQKLATKAVKLLEERWIDSDS
jgi:hypothetical protein